MPPVSTQLRRCLVLAAALAAVGYGPRAASQDATAVPSAFVGTFAGSRQRHTRGGGCTMDEISEVALTVAPSGVVTWAVTTYNNIECDPSAGYDAAPTACHFEGDGRVSGGSGSARSATVTLAQRVATGAPMVSDTSLRVWRCDGAQVTLPRELEPTGCTQLGYADTAAYRRAEIGAAVGCGYGRAFTSGAALTLAVRGETLRLVEHTRHPQTTVMRRLAADEGDPTASVATPRGAHTLTDAEIATGREQHRSAIEQCIAGRPTLHVRVEYVIAPTGTVTTAHADVIDVAGARSCIVAEVRSWVFPPSDASLSTWFELNPAAAPTLAGPPPSTEPDAPSTPPPSPSIDGDAAEPAPRSAVPDADALRAALRAHSTDVLACTSGQPIDATVRVTFTSSGDMTEAEIIGGAMLATAAQRTCIADALRTIRVEPFSRPTWQTIENIAARPD